MAITRRRSKGSSARASTDAAIRRSARYGSFIRFTKSKRPSARNRSSLLFLHFKEERACHPERSAQRRTTYAPRRGSQPRRPRLTAIATAPRTSDQLFGGGGRATSERRRCRWETTE